MRNYEWEAICLDANGESQALGGSFEADAYTSSETEALMQAQSKANSYGYDHDTVELIEVVLVSITEATE